jgi:hypothetical protein
MTDKLTDANEVLFRQIHPSQFLDGEPASSAFIPSSKDENKLSVDRSALTTAQQSYTTYTSNGLASVAVFGVTVGEFSGHQIECLADPLAENKAHALADYSTHSKSAQKNIGKKLKQQAIQRGCVYFPSQ